MMDNCETVLGLIVAAGSGKRMNSKVAKQYLLVGGRPLVLYSLKLFDRCEQIDSIFIVIPKNDRDKFVKSVLTSAQIKKRIHIVDGGVTRQESVLLGLKAMYPFSGLVAIHDGARPLAGDKMLTDCIATARKTGACILGVPVSDTLKKVDADVNIEKTIDRQGVWMAQTPQVFHHNLIYHAHQQARRTKLTVTDDAMLLEKMGISVSMVAGTKANLKITTPEDLPLAEALIRATPTSMKLPFYAK